MPSFRVPASLRDGWNRTRVLVVAGAAVLVVLIVALALTLGGSSDPTPSASSTSSSATASSSAGASTSAATPTAPAAPSATAPGDPNQPPPSLPAVPLDATADAGNGVTARLASIDAVTSEAGQPGQIAGPALRVTVRITNGSGADFSLDAVSVNLAYGPDNTPGSPAQHSSTAPFSGVLPAGDEAEAVYVFNVPEDARDLVTVEVGYQPGAPLMIFSGPVD